MFIKSSQLFILLDLDQQQFRQFLAHFYKFLIDELLKNLIDPKWPNRHGAALALGKICMQADIWLF